MATTNFFISLHKPLSAPEPKYEQGQAIIAFAPYLSLRIACVARAKRGGWRKKNARGKREGSACLKDPVFCITHTKFLVTQLRALSINCQYVYQSELRMHFFTTWDFLFTRAGLFKAGLT